MIRRPAWEKHLRRSIRGRAKRPRRRSWLTTRWFALLVVTAVAALLAGSGRSDLGLYGEGIGIGILGGLFGYHLGARLRFCRQLHLWAGIWTPGGRKEFRRLQLRESAPWIAGDLIAALAICGLVPCLDADVEVVPLFGGLAIAGLTGFVLAGGVWGNRALYLGGLGVIAFAVISGWTDHDKDQEFYQRLVSMAAYGWPPSLPWSMMHGPLPALSLQGVLLAGVLAISVRDWIRSWREWPVPLQFDTPPGPEAGLVPEIPDATPEVDPGIGETQRSDIRRSVAFEWLGMAGYLDPEMSPLGRVLWRFLTPRERYLSCLGNPHNGWWFRQSLWAAAALAAMVAVALLPRFIEFSDNHHAAWVVSLMALGAAAFYFGWPSRHSVFEPWLERMTTEATGAFPVFAMLPVTAREWLHAVGKEWLVRGTWISLLWGLALAMAYCGQEGDASPRAAWTLAFLPALLAAALFPLSALVLSLRAVAGPLLATHGSTRSMPAMLLALLCLLGSVLAAFCLAVGKDAHVVALISLAVSLLSGWASLRFTRMRCESRRLDLKPQPLA